MNLNLNIQALETWYLQHQRLLPFRENSEPYFIWVSEIMAQQTQIETMIPYFKRFIKRYPTIEDLAKTDSDALLQVVAGIGYYRRFKHMLEAAKLIVERFSGVFPSTYEEVRSLPGVGDYTAGAIMSIAFNQPYAATDGNVIRVLSRFYLIQEDMRKPSHRKMIHQQNQALILKATPRLYTQVLMELGALICRPQKPLCEECPLKTTCRAYEQGLVNELPVITPLVKPKLKKFTTLILKYLNKTALIKKEEGLLSGMYLYPQYENKTIEEVKEDFINLGYHIQQIEYKADYTHVFTHQKWQMKVYEVELSKPPRDDSLIFIEDISLLPMATAHRKIPH